MTDNGTPKVCDEGEACMFGSVYSDDLRPPSLDYFRDCRPLNESLPNCYNETLHEVTYPLSIVLDSTNKPTTFKFHWFFGEV